MNRCRVFSEQVDCVFDLRCLIGIISGNSGYSLIVHRNVVFFFGRTPIGGFSLPAIHHSPRISVANAFISITESLPNIPTKLTNTVKSVALSSAVPVVVEMSVGAARECLAAPRPATSTIA